MGNQSRSYGALPATPTVVNASHLNPSQTGWYSICLLQRDGRV